MKGKSYSLRLGLMALVVVLIFGALGSLSLARDAFDDDYDDCPSRTRLDAVEGLAIDRTDEADEIRVSWDALPTSTLRSLGSNSYKARLTIIVDGDDKDRDENVALGDTSRVFDEIDFTKELTISVAVTLGDYVISDIAEVDFTSGMPAPKFSTGIRMAPSTAADFDASPSGLAKTPRWLDLSGTTDDDNVEAREYGSFYYLGFNDLFDNWYIRTKGGTIADTDASPASKPSSPKFRVGLAHGNGTLTPGDADFENYRIVIEDSNGDHLGYQAETVAATNTYGNDKIVFGESTTLLTSVNLTAPGSSNTAGDSASYFTNIRRSNRLDNPRSGDPARNAYFAEVSIGTDFPLEGPGNDDLSYANIGVVDPNGWIDETLGASSLFADAPVEYFDFPRDVFEDDGTYTIKAWAEDDDSTRISPQASIELNVREQGTSTSRYMGYTVAFGGNPVMRTWDATDTAGLVLTVYGFSIRDE